MKKVNRPYRGRCHVQSECRIIFYETLIDMIDSDSNDEVCIEFDLECLLGNDKDADLQKSFKGTKHLYDWIYIRILSHYGKNGIKVRSKKLSKTKIRMWFWKKGGIKDGNKYK